MPNAKFSTLIVHIPKAIMPHSSQDVYGKFNEEIRTLASRLEKLGSKKLRRFVIIGLIWGGNEVDNLLFIRTEAPYTLNFLVYIQNIYHNQTCREEEYKFPYVMAKSIPFQEDFESRLKDLWNEILQRISQDPLSDMEIFHEEQEVFYHRLFLESEDSEKEYIGIYQSFSAWWNSLAGRFSIESGMCIKSEKLYMDLTKELEQKEIVPNKELQISFLYDHGPNREMSSYFAVVSINDLVLNYKETLPRILECF